MKITDIAVRKLDHDDPRYPDQTAARPFVDVYLCSITLESGEPFEAAYFVPEEERSMSIEAASTMMKIFAASIARMDEKQEAA